MKMFIGAAILVWLAVGTTAGAQRGLFHDDMAVTCTTGAEVASTMLAGPLNYAGVDPHVSCEDVQPSR